MFEPFLRSIILNKVSEVSNYPYNIPAVKNLTRIDFTVPVTFFVGENGSGKSTLLEAIAIAYGFNAEGGSRNFRFSTRSDHSELYKSLKLSHGLNRPTDNYFLRAESFYNVATEIDNRDLGPSFDPPLSEAYGVDSLHDVSHGQSFLALLNNRLRGNGLYIFDEPEAALSPVGQLAVLRRIKQLSELRSQFIIATHSPLLLAYPGAKILEFSEHGIREIEYKMTDNYLIYKRFLTDDAMLRDVLE